MLRDRAAALSSLFSRCTVCPHLPPFHHALLFPDAVGSVDVTATPRLGTAARVHLISTAAAFWRCAHRNARPCRCGGGEKGDRLKRRRRREEDSTLPTICPALSPLHACRAPRNLLHARPEAASSPRSLLRRIARAARSYCPCRTGASPVPHIHTHIHPHTPSHAPYDALQRPPHAAVPRPHLRARHVLKRLPRLQRGRVADEAGATTGYLRGGVGRVRGGKGAWVEGVKG